MRKRFNDTGLCVPGRHYMVDTSAKIEQLIRLVEEGAYFTINRPRQFGKTTTLALLAKQLNQRSEYLALGVSFEGIDTVTYQRQDAFLTVFLKLLREESEYLGLPELTRLLEQHIGQVADMQTLSECLSRLIKTVTPEKAWVLLIDEVDKSSNNQLFLDFLGLLRKKYLRRNEGKEATFQSVILAGVHDVKTLKAKIRPDAEQKPFDRAQDRYNSPWNIAVDFTVDLSFSPADIATMLQEYQQDKQIALDIPAIAAKLFYYTSGYPYLVSKLCKFIDEDLLPARQNRDWSVSDVDAAVAMIVNEGYTTTLFDSLIKNLENQPELYDNVFNIVINGQKIPFNVNAPVIHLGVLYGILAPSPEGCRIHNRIYEQRIYNYLLAKVLTAQPTTTLAVSPDYYAEEGLNLRLVLQKFQEFMREHYSHRDQAFLEREGRLLFLAFLKPIINGKGFDFKEPNVADERRMDVVITYKQHRYVVELKRWYGPKAHQEGLQQLSAYLDMYGLKEGYLLIYDFSKHKTYKQETIAFQDKQIFAVWV